MKKFKYLFLFLCTLFVHDLALAKETFYMVGSTRSGNGSGKNWTNARALSGNDALAAAINNAEPGDSIYIGSPTYSTVTFTPGKPLPLKAGVKVFGGYYNVSRSNNSGERPPRDFSKTVLSGSTNVIEAQNADVTGALYDGFTITGLTSGSAIYLVGVTTQDDQPTFKNITISNCSGENGPIYMERVGSENNPMRADGIIIENNNQNSHLTNNTSAKYTNLIARNNSTTGAGGVFYATNSALEIDGGTFTNNTATGSGGTVSAVATEIHFTNIIATNNSSGEDGGAFHIALTQEGEFENMRISGNTAANGGGIYLSVVNHAVIKNIQIENNIANVDGGGIYLTSVSKAQIENAQIIKNYANVNGGGIYITTGGGYAGGNKDIKYKDVTISNNVASCGYGGGIYNTTVGFFLEDFCVENNYAALSGGGLFNTTTRSEIRKGVIRSNTSAGGDLGGGGLHFTTDLGIGTTSVDIENVEIAGNYAVGKGGGILFTTVHRKTFRNCLIVDNYSSSKGGGVFATTVHNGEYINTTISNNKAIRGGSGFYFEGASVKNLQFKNSIIWGNTPRFPGSPDDIVSELSDADYHLNNSIMTDPGFENKPNITYFDSGNWSAKEGVTFELNNENRVSYEGLGSNYRLKENSPAINAGNNSHFPGAATSMDLDGRPRLVDGTIDLGPYEGVGGVSDFECYDYDRAQCIPVLIWLGHNTNWNDAANWSPRGIPGDCTDVYIPFVSVEGQSEFVFPVLEATGANEAVCDRIFFLPGAQLGHQDLLTYNEAHVEINYGKGFMNQQEEIFYKSFVEKGKEGITSKDRVALAANYGSEPIDREQWHMFSSPLKSVFTGDFGFGGFPMSFIRKFSAKHEAGGGAFEKGGWEPYNNEGHYGFSAGEGFAHYLYGASDDIWSLDHIDQWTGSILTDNKVIASEPKHISGDDRKFGLGASNGIIHLPMYEDKYLSDAHRNHEYKDGRSHFHLFLQHPVSSPDFYNWTGEVHHDARENAYRFILEGDNKKMTFPFSFRPEAADGFILVGNPYMAILDFGKFQKGNNSYIRDSYFKYVYQGSEGSYETSNAPIAPMQSVLMQVTNNYLNNTDAKLTIMDSFLTTDPEISLRASEDTSNQITITARNENGVIKAYIEQLEDAEDIYGDEDLTKIINVPMTGKLPEIYTFAPDENGNNVGMIINRVKSNNLIIPLAIITTYAGEMSFDFSGMDTYNAKVMFIDLENNQEIDVTDKDLATYTFVNTPILNEKGEALANEERFLIQLSPKNETGIDKVDNSRAIAYISKGKLSVMSPSPIKEIIFYDIQGRALWREAGMNTSVFTKELQTETGVYIVKVFSEAGVNEIKVIR